MSTQPNTAEKKVPPDITQIFNFTRMLGDDLGDLMNCNCMEWRSELREAVKDWRDGGAEPDWNYFRAEMNEYCRDEGMPALFEIKDEEAINA